MKLTYPLVLVKNGLDIGWFCNDSGQTLDMFPVGVVISFHLRNLKLISDVTDNHIIRSIRIIRF